jgi:RHS repeat-associated protein
VTEHADQSGLLYRRNRYYDPKSGQFTQKDPIGIAGGLNLYGFAGGDPVNFSDPFGLCGGKAGEVPCAIEYAAVGAMAGAAAAAAGTGMAAVATGGTALLAAPITVPHGAQIGAAIGAVAGTIADNADLIASEMGRFRETLGAVGRGIKVILIGGALAPGQSTPSAGGDRVPPPPQAEQPATERKPRGKGARP